MAGTLTPQALRQEFIKYARTKGWWEAWSSEPGKGAYMQFSDASASYSGVDLWSIDMFKRGNWCVVRFFQVFQNDKCEALQPWPTSWTWKPGMAMVNSWFAEHKIPITDDLNVVFDKVWDLAKCLYAQVKG